MLSSEQLYQGLFFVVAIYPIYFLWRDISNDHDEQWLAGGIIGAYIFDLITYYISPHIKNTFWKHAIYCCRDATLGFQLATCLFASFRQIILSHPQIDTEKDGNIVTGWLLMLMAVTSFNLLKLHQTDKKVNKASQEQSV